MEAAATTFSPPVELLLQLGDPDPEPDVRSEPWRDYRGLGLTEAHVPELLRILSEPNFHDDPRDDAAWWAPIHAWRAVAQLGTFEAAPALLAAANIRDESDDDWFVGELPLVFVALGPQCIPELARFVIDRSNGACARGAAMTALAKIGLAAPESRDAAVEALCAQLRNCLGDEPYINGTAIAYLLDLSAVEEAETIERAFASGFVDEGICGSWVCARAALRVPGMGLVTDESPRNPNSLDELRMRLDRSWTPRQLPAYDARSAAPQRSKKRRHRRRR